MSKYIVIFFCIISSSSLAQYSDVKFAASFDLVFNSGDLLIGGGLGAHLEEADVRVLGTFLARPYERKVLVEQSSNFLIRYLERRYFFGPTVEKHFEFDDSGFGFAIQTGILHTWGSYSGSNNKPDSKWIANIGGGVDCDLGGVLIRLSYRHIPVPQVESKQMVGISIVY